MDSYKVRYTLKQVGLVEEIVAAESDFMARRVVQSKYPKDEVLIVQATKQPTPRDEKR